MYWFIEIFDSGDGSAELAKAAREANHEVIVKSYFPYCDIDYGGLCITPADKVMFHGSFQTLSEFQKECSIASPGAWCNLHHFQCSIYFAHLGKFLLNNNYAILPVAELQRMKWDVYKAFAKDAKIFVRPDKGIKSFTGQLLDLQDFDRFWNNSTYCSAEPTDLIVISSPKEIQGEWRIVVSSKGEIVAVSSYMYQSNRTYIPGAPNGAIEFVKEILKVGYHPNPMYVMDIAQDTNGKFHLIELNAFSTSSLYVCDMNAIVKKVEELIE